jgi:hypothetical protein
LTRKNASNAAFATKPASLRRSRSFNTREYRK